MSSVRLLLLAAALWLPVGALFGADVILCGLGGAPEYEQKFADWGGRLRAVLVDKMERASEDVHLFLAQPGEGSPARPSRLEAIRELFAQLAANHNAEDDLFIYLIGHGSHLAETSKFQLPGPDLSAAELGELLAETPAKRIVLVHGGSAGAGFINALSGSDRIICSATKSVRETNAPEFMAFFVQALEDGGADRNRDERISVWEACEQAALLTQSWYTAQKLIATEHAILDDNGDGLGSRLARDPLERMPAADDDAGDGALAKRVYLKDLTFPDAVPPELVTRYLDLLNQVENLRAERADPPEAAYYRRLEDLLIQAAKTHRQIRRLAGWE